MNRIAQNRIANSRRAPRLPCTISRVIGVGALCLVALAAPMASAQDASAQASGQAPAAAQDNPLASGQTQLATRFKKLESILLRSAEIEAVSNPTRAALMRQAAALAKQVQLSDSLVRAARSLEQKQYSQAIEDQKASLDNLNKILELLQSENRTDRVREQRDQVRRTIEETERLLRLESSLRGRTEGGTATEKAASDQQKLAEKAAQIAKDLSPESPDAKDKQGDSKAEGKKSGQDKADKSKEGQSPDGKDSDKKPSDSENSSDKNKSDGKSSESPGDKKNADDKKSDDSKSADPKADEKKNDKPSDGQNKDGKNKPSDSKDSDKAAEKQPASDQQPGQSNPSENKPSENKPSDDKSGEGKPSPSKPKQSKPSDQQQSQPAEDSQQPSGEQSESNDSEPEPKNPVDRATQRLKKAQKNMQEAQKELEKGERKDAVEKQRQAEQELKSAIEELEEILRQLREEEIERSLSALEERLRLMLQLQNKVLDESKRLQEIGAGGNDRQVEIRANSLASDEKKILGEAQRALLLLREEGTSAAFPESLSHIISDMQKVVDRLSKADIGKLTIGIEEDIVSSLEELVAAMSEIKKENKERKEQQAQAPGGQQGQPGEQPLVNQLAEMRLIKTLQVRINKRTKTLSEALKDPNDVVGQVEAADIQNQLRELAERQSNIKQVTRDIVIGKNKQ